VTAYYNEIDPYAAQWLRNLISAGHISPGVVDERSIEDVCPDELMGYTQCHFFAGIGVWSLALRRAGWPDHRPVWTGSCPCQPFSQAGAGAGFADERHLWPHFRWVIEQCRPAVVFGEQVASKAAEPWIDLVHADLEALGYAFGAVPFPSAGVGAPHIRDRLFWVGHADRSRLEGYPRHGGAEGWKGQGGSVASAVVSSGVAGCEFCGYVFDVELLGRHGCPNCEGDGLEDAHQTNGFWQDADWLGCRDGKWRPVEPGTFPLANGTASRVGRLRADWRACAEQEEGWRVGRLRCYGNAINAETAKTFIEAYLDAKN
jgi:DNA (cytosine-5)-methyltransferase 1